MKVCSTPQITCTVTNIGGKGLTTILACCAHQKCIIDDVLSYSKLDSNLLVITPVKVEPARVMQDVHKMFEMDAQKAVIDFRARTDDSVDNLDIQWLMMDPSRVKQILINLISNAIKFTRSEAVRRITLIMSASLEAPSSDGAVQYAPASRSVADNFLAEHEWGSGEIVYLKFSISDTGRGLNLKEQEKLFHRFSQASPKTHIEYGGSGLGLFITRQLTELQGGEVGVASEPEKGSTFAFYIRTRRTDALELTLSRMSSPASLAPISAPARPPEAGAIAQGAPKDSWNSNMPHVSPRPKAVQPEWQPCVLVVEVCFCCFSGIGSS